MFQDCRGRKSEMRRERGKKGTSGVFTGAEVFGCMNKEEVSEAKLLLDKSS